MTDDAILITITFITLAICVLILDYRVKKIQRVLWQRRDKRGRFVK